ARRRSSASTGTSSTPPSRPDHDQLTPLVAQWATVARRFGRRWLLVGAGAAALVGVSAVRVPAAEVTADPAALRARIRATVPSYVGYAESTGQLGLPQISQLESTVGLLTGTTRIRAYVG